MILAWLRFRLSSVWPCVLGHAMADSGRATLAISHPGSLLIGGPIGLIGLVPAWALEIFLIATGRLRAPEPAL